jgi:Ala-tRNA(Pro) deacylase
MTPSPSDPLYAHLGTLGIAYTRVDHPAVFTCEESERVVPPLPGARTKNLFLRDKKGRRHLLVVAAQDKRVDLRALGDRIDAKGLMLASDERLAKYLGVSPGAVSILALINDTACEVELVVDADVWSADAVLAHPLVNTATLVIPHGELQRFLQVLRHEPNVIELPQAMMG